MFSPFLGQLHVEMVPGVMREGRRVAGRAGAQESWFSQVLSGWELGWGCVCLLQVLTCFLPHTLLAGRSWVTADAQKQEVLCPLLPP